MGVFGADVEQLEHLARSMARAGEAIGRTTLRVQDALHNTLWTGPDAERFRTQWGTHSKRLDLASDALKGLASDLLRQAEEQRIVSGGHRREPVTSNVPGLASIADLLGMTQHSSGLAPSGTPSLTDRRRAESLLAAFPSEIPRILRGESGLGDLKPSAASLLHELDAELASGSTSFDASKSWSGQKSGSAAWATYEIAANAQIGAEGNLEGFVGLEDGELRAGLEAGLKIGAYGEASASTELLGFVPLGVHGEAMVGAEANAAGDLSIGEDGARASLAADGFIGARAGGEGDLKIGDYGGAEVGGEAWAGAGVELGGDAEIGWDRVEVGFTLGAGWGIGAQTSLAVSFSPKNILGELPGVRELADIRDLGLDDVEKFVASSVDPLGVAQGSVSKGVDAFKSAGSKLQSVGSKALSWL